MTNDSQLLTELAAAQAGLTLTQSQVAQLLAYRQFLLNWNTHTNLTAIRDPYDFLVKHLLDAFNVLRVARLTAGAHWVDVGSGAGVPGLVLKLLAPQIQLTLVESIGKKCTFLQAACEHLGVSGVVVHPLRAEDAGHLPALREQADWVVARAVARLPILLEYLLPLAKLGGRVLAMKGSDTADAELADSRTALRTLGGVFVQRTDYHLPDVPVAHSLLVFAKRAKTPPFYPRKAGIPAKQPLGVPKEGA